MTTLIWAGSESPSIMNALYDNGVRHFLFSYYWILLMHREEALRKFFHTRPDCHLTLDSGAFTMAQKATAGKEVPHPREFFARYMDYLKVYGSMWSRIAEPDFDGIDDVDADGNKVVDVSVEQVDVWRSEMLDTFPHLNIMPVYHAWRGRTAWSEYVNDPRIKCLAIGRNPPHDGMMRRYVAEAHRAGKPVHGMAMTKFNTLLNWVPFDSADSSSYLGGQKYGNIYIWQNNHLLNLTKANKGENRAKAYRAYFRARGCDPDLVVKRDPDEVLKCNIRTWLLVGKTFEQLRKQQGMTVGTEPAGESLPFHPPKTRRA